MRISLTNSVSLKEYKQNEIDYLKLENARIRNSNNNTKNENLTSLLEEHGNRVIMFEDQVRNLKSENQKLKSENSSSHLSLVELKQVIHQLKSDIQTHEEKSRLENMKSRDNLLVKVQSMKEQKKAKEEEINQKNKFLNQVKTSYHKNKNTTIVAEQLVNEAKDFFIENSVVVTTITKELVSLKNPSLQRTFAEFRKKYDKMQIQLQKHTFNRTEDNQVPKRAPSRNGSIVLSRKNSISKNKSFCSVSSVASKKFIGNNSGVSVRSNKSNISIKSNLSKKQQTIKNTKTPKKQSQTTGSNTFNSHYNQISRLQEDLEGLKAQYKRLISQNSNGLTTDPLIRDNLNFCASEIQQKTKQLLQLKKGQILD